MNKIEEFRGMLGLSRPELATLVGVDRSMMWRYEKNLSIPSDRIKVRIAGVLQRSVEEIFFSQSVAFNTTVAPGLTGAMGQRSKDGGESDQEHGRA